MSVKRGLSDSLPPKQVSVNICVKMERLEHWDRNVATFAPSVHCCAVGRRVDFCRSLFANLKRSSLGASGR